MLCANLIIDTTEEHIASNWIRIVTFLDDRKFFSSACFRQMFLKIFAMDQIGSKSCLGKRKRGGGDRKGYCKEYEVLDHTIT